ncbi:hypothetical protein [Vibrio nigripulchritudo]|uniref:hypothetical protein n=1 Tax=Vibrio nigripulchritudo TaxID=28173 RepID=UPI00248F5062|nr:hypothetical protein [Vibrio nigripulchritudo]BDU35742.1 hypothetical protein TUMSATVNIG2_02110 [Vibrio nigripulchritudo]BDU41412.1 hypothetical protein TUMSATVNIG3_02100 [Vibrio nigripulchritudo]
MNLYPKYSENIIVFVLFQGKGSWYVTDKDIWFLDRVSFASAFGVPAEQKDIKLLEDLIDGNGKSLLSEIREFKVTTQELRELIDVYPPLSIDESILEMRPSVYVDIDTRTLINLFPEPSGVFENYVPKNWSASSGDFWDLIPSELVYWIVNGESKIQ